jgi:hypothetical protein
LNYTAYGATTDICPLGNNVIVEPIATLETSGKVTCVEVSSPFVPRIPENRPIAVAEIFPLLKVQVTLSPLAIKYFFFFYVGAVGSVSTKLKVS